MKILDEIGKPWRVMVELPNCPELGLLGIKYRNLRCAIRETDQAGKFLASVDELKGTKIKPKRFGFTVSKRHISQNAISATVTCTPTGRPFNGRGFEKNGVVYLIDLSHFIQVRAVCSDQNAEDEPATEWEINSVRFSSRFDAQSVVVEEETSYVEMPINLRTRYVLGEKVTSPFPTLDEVRTEVKEKVRGISDEEAREYIANFIESMAWAYMYAFGVDPDAVQDTQPQLQIQPQPVPQPQPAVAIAEPEEPEVYLQATGTDDSVAEQTAFEQSTAAMQAEAMTAQKINSRRRRGQSRRNNTNHNHNGDGYEKRGGFRS